MKGGWKYTSIVRRFLRRILGQTASISHHDEGALPLWAMGYGVATA